jgi:hypothetical protein
MAVTTDLTLIVGISGVILPRSCAHDDIQITAGRCVSAAGRIPSFKVNEISPRNQCRRAARKAWNHEIDNAGAVAGNVMLIQSAAIRIGLLAFNGCPDVLASQIQRRHIVGRKKFQLDRDAIAAWKWLSKNLSGHKCYRVDFMRGPTYSWLLQLMYWY